MTVLQYTIATRERTGTLTATDGAGHVRVTLKFDRYGVLGDEAELERELRSAIARFCTDAAGQFVCDPRLTVLAVPDTGGRTLILEGVEQ
jgi:hypothetical protein